MATHPRYRTEAGRHCVDVRLTTVEQMVDTRDPAPFRARDLDPDLVDYLFGAAEDLLPHGAIRIVFWFPSPPAAAEVGPAYRAHLANELARGDRQRRRQRRINQASLVVAVVLLVALQGLAELALRLPASSVRQAVREGLVILSWVVLWRPVDLLIYEWIPARRTRRLWQLLHDAEIEVRAGAGPADPPP